MYVLVKKRFYIAVMYTDIERPRPRQRSKIKLT